MRRRGTAAIVACLAQLVCACEEPLLLSRGEEQLRVGALLSARLSRSLETLPGVASAEVHLALPSTANYAQSLAPEPRASVLLHARAESPRVDVAAVQSLVAGAVTDLEPSAVRVVLTQPDPPRAPVPVLTRVGPFMVEAQSEPGLRALLVGLLLVQMALALLLGLVLSRGRRRAATSDE